MDQSTLNKLIVILENNEGVSLSINLPIINLKLNIAVKKNK